MLEYEIVDVFTGRAYTGNPLAVVFGAGELTPSGMQAIAAEFNLSETAFVVPTTSPEADYRVRIFTPKAELPYAGHPSIGTAVTLARRGEVEEGELVQECGAGLLAVTVSGAFATLTGASATIADPIDPAPYLAACGLGADDLAGRLRVAGTGLEFPYLPVTEDALDRAHPITDDSVDEVYLFTWDAEKATARARLFDPAKGIVEDPATGSAALGLGVYLVAEGWAAPDGDTSYLIEQGTHIDRPSHLECVVSASEGVVERVTVRGQVLPIARGELVALP
ncbi:PhzF family phenazine biosynthesis protein [Stackebrandtia soli]|uniref:PhzF family phenazine biosynthesis protein n=1 Tax=Stackebrandtia soli TaxID=1892856 RepID=UPI0039EA1708